MADKTADLAGPGIGNYDDLKKELPDDYEPLLTPMETMKAVFAIKTHIEENLCKALNLQMVQVPLIVDRDSGVNDYLDRDGSRTPVEFPCGLGLDKPITTQYFLFLVNALQGYFGESLKYTGTSAMELVGQRLPATLELFRPEWMAMVLIYWCMAVPSRVGISIGWLVGLVQDVARDALLGQYALAFALIAFLTLHLHQRLRIFPIWQQALSVLGLLVNDRIILLWIISLRGEPLPSMMFWLPPIVGTLLWPWLFLALHRFRGSSKQRACPGNNAV